MSDKNKGNDNGNGNDSGKCNRDENRNAPLPPPELPGYTADDFSRMSEADDACFYRRDRLVQHLDGTALATVEALIARLVVEEKPAILDLMASIDSHIPDSVGPSRVVGLGLNRNELEANPLLDERIVHDLNGDLRLPFDDASFDVVLNTVSVDYLVRPVALFREVGRVLRPGGLFLAIFSNRYFEPKAVKVWRESSEGQRVDLVRQMFRSAGGFDETSLFVSRGRARPEDDRYAELGIPSDPVYAVYADRLGGTRRDPRPDTAGLAGMAVSPDDVAERKKRIRETLCCPYCREKLTKYEVPQHPFTQWDNEFMYVCFNNACSYFTGSWETMHRQGNVGLSYRLMYNPVSDSCMATPVPSPGDSRTSLRG